MRRTLPAVLLTVGTFARLVALPAQAPTAAAPAAEFPMEFSGVRSVRALPDGRLVVTDQRDRKVYLVDFEGRSRRELGREGAGPREYRGVGHVYRDRAGGVVVYDPQQRRLLPIDAGGALQDVRPIESASATFNSISADGPDMYAPDTLGNVVTAMRDPGVADSMPLERAGRHAGQLTRLKLPESRAVESGTAGVRMRQGVAFSPRDLYAVAADGWVAVVRSTPYRVEWYPPGGAVVRGPAVPVTAVPVTEADKKAVRDRQAAMLAGGGGPVATVNGRSVRPPMAEPVFATTKGPTTGRVALIDEQGRLWVEREQAAGATTALLDVFDRRGAIVHRMALPGNARVVGFDRSWVYAVRTDDDDVQHLQRYRLPS